MGIINSGGPAFPVPETSRGEMMPPCSGMSLRDYFAGQCLTGMSLINISKDGYTVIAETSDVVSKCIEIADLLIQELNKGS